MLKSANKWDIGAIAQEKAARKRSSWSAFEAPTEEETTKVADRLGFASEAMQIAASRGLLFSATCLDGHRSFVVADSARLSAVAFRLDGLPWDRTNRISRTLPGSVGGWPVGIGEASQFPAVALVCGGIDLLAALHLSCCVDREDIIAPVAMLSSSMHIDDVVLPKFKGMQVKIFPHLDSAGQAAAQGWFDQLHGVAASVTGYSFEGLSRPDGPVADLNDFARLLPENPSAEELATMEALLRDAFTL